MKVGILTFPNSPSYGASLQMTALYSYLRNMGVDVEVINYINDYMSSKQHIYRGVKKRLLYRALIGVLDYPNTYLFKAFEDAVIRYPAKPIHDDLGLGKISTRYSHIICGSDQVWNPEITGNDLNYFVRFCDDSVKRIAYAPSFGITELNAEYGNNVKQELKKFSALSVREESGKRIVNSLVEQDCKLVIDPSMLMTKEFWESKAKPIKNLPKHYIAMFVLNTNSDLIKEFYEYFSNLVGLPVMVIGGNLLSKVRNKNSVFPIGPAEWLTLIKNADYVISDSFHGTAFSILFDKQFYSSIVSSTSSRIKMLLQTFNLENRLIENNPKDGSIDYIEYQEVHDILQKKRKESQRYLRNSLGLPEGKSTNE